MRINSTFYFLLFILLLCSCSNENRPKSQKDKRLEIIQKMLSFEIPDEWLAEPLCLDEYQDQSWVINDSCVIERIMPKENEKDVLVIVRSVNAKDNRVYWSLEYPLGISSALSADIAKVAFFKNKIFLVEYNSIATGATWSIYDPIKGQISTNKFTLGMPVSHSEYRNEAHLLVKNNKLYIFGNESGQYYLEVFSIEPFKQLQRYAAATPDK